MCLCSCDFFLALLALIFPPLPVWVKRGLCSADSVINILLCVLGFLPGLIHAWYIIAKYPEPDFEYEALAQDTERANGRVTYVVVHPNQAGRPGQAQAVAPRPQENMNYGTAAVATAPSAPAAAAAPASASAAGSSAAAGSSSADNAGEGRSDGPPPSYAQVVAGDNKIQSQD